jgi:glycosyltransferase involved in cell wall biosynthesis
LETCHSRVPRQPIATVPGLVSIIIPTFGRGRDFLLKALRSCIRQTYRSVEVLIVNDNRHDSPLHRVVSELVLSEFPDDSRIRVMETTGGLGGSNARNMGMAAARGEYVAFLDDDDELLAESVAVRLGVLKRMEVDFVCSDFFKEKGRRRKYAEVSVGDLEEFLISGYCHTPCLLIRRKSALDVGGFPDVPKFQDYLFVLTLLGNGKVGVRVPVPLYVQNVHREQRITNNASFEIAWRRRREIEARYVKDITERAKKDVSYRWEIEKVKSGQANGSEGFYILLASLKRINSKRNVLLFVKALLIYVAPGIRRLSIRA